MEYIQTLKLQVEIYSNTKIKSWNIFKHKHYKLTYIQKLGLQLKYIQTLKNYKLRYQKFCALKLIKDHS